jgi:hypothetical protein
MAELTAETVNERLKAGLAGRDRWVFLATRGCAHAVVELVVHLVTGGVDCRHVDYSTFEFLHVPTMHTQTVAVLTVRKADLSRTAVKRLVRSWGRGRLQKEHDLILCYHGEADGHALMAFAATAERGAFGTGAVGAN